MTTALGFDDAYHAARARVDRIIKDSSLSSVDVDLSDLNNLDRLPFDLEFANNITSININNTCISDASVLRDMTWLVELRMSNTRVTDMSFVRFLPKLERVYFRNLPLTDQNVAAISLIEDVMQRVQLLKDYYPFDGAENDEKGFGLQIIPPTYPGPELEINTDFKLAIKTNNNFFGASDVDETSVLVSIITKFIDQLILEVGGESNNITIGEVSIFQYRRALNAYPNTSIDLLWAYGGCLTADNEFRMLSTMKIARSFEGDPETIHSIKQLFAGYHNNFVMLHGALINSTKRGIVLDARAKQYNQLINYRLLAAHGTKVIEALKSYDVSSPAVDKMLDNVSMTARETDDRRVYYTFAATHSNAMATIARTILVAASTVGVGLMTNFVYDASKLNLLAESGVANLIRFVLDNELQIRSALAASFAHIEWWNSFVYWLKAILPNDT